MARPLPSKNSRKDSQKREFPGRGLNPGTSEYDAEAITTGPQRSVTVRQMSRRGDKVNINLMMMTTYTKLSPRRAW
jgi:hypothetical protein